MVDVYLEKVKKHVELNILVIIETDVLESAKIGFNDECSELCLLYCYVLYQFCFDNSYKDNNINILFLHKKNYFR